MLQWATWCPFSRELMPELVKFYDKYHEDGLEIIANCPNFSDHDGSDRIPTIMENGYDRWYNVDIDDIGSHSTEHGNYDLAIFNEKHTPYVGAIFDQEGNLLFSSNEGIQDPVQHRFGQPAFTNLIPFLETLFGPLDNDDDKYSSTDYSMDGEVKTIQTATVGKGIDIVFMGDGYSDKDMISGLYDKLMGEAAEEFFAIEPYKSMKDRFNVYAVKAVSEKGKVSVGNNTAFSTRFTGGTAIEGDLDRCYEYALKVPGISSRDNLLVCVMVNAARQGGTAHMSLSSQPSVAFYSSILNDRELFGPALRHEAGGHGFAFLDDEYTQSYEDVPQQTVAYKTSQWNEYGWWANVDFTDDPAKVK